MNRSRALTSNRIQAGACLPSLPARLEIMKLPLSLHIAVTAVIGGLLTGVTALNVLGPLFLSLFFLATGSACLNNVQDRDLDAVCERTRKRAIPAERLSGRDASIQGMVLLVLGAVLLAFPKFSPLALVLGLAAVAQYSLVYTRLKRRTAYAVLPGAVCGMLPPLIGWIYAGGSGFTLEIALVMLLIGVWQIPHYWIILILHLPDAKGRGFPPTMLAHLKEAGLRRNAFIWIMSFGCLSMLPVFLNASVNGVPAALLVLNALLLQIFSFIVLLLKRNRMERLLHICLSSCLLIALLLPVLPRLI